MIARTTLTLIAGLFASAAPAFATLLPTPQVSGQRTAPGIALPEGTERVRLANANTVVRNLNDANGRALMELENGTPLAVFRERAGWLLVEIPGGFPVWVFGKFLAETDDPNVLECTSNAVNLRPRPERSNSYPLGGRLQMGDRVLVIERADATLPLEKDWARVWSPSGVRAWVKVTDTYEPASGSDLDQLWTSFESRLTHRVPPQVAPKGRAVNASSTSQPEGEPGGTTEPTSTGSADPEEAARAALEQAIRAEEAERAKASPDYAAIRAAFQGVVQLAPGGLSAQLARQRLETVDARESAAKLAEELEEEKLRRIRESMQRNQDVWDETRQKDPHFGRFAGRGVLERYERAGQTPRYLLRWGGEAVFAVTCSDGRYELGLFAGYEVGIDGVGLVGDDELPQLDAERIVVLSRR